MSDNLVSVGEEFERELFALIAEQIDSTAELGRETVIDALDIDSLDLIEIAQTVNDKFGIRVDAQVMRGAASLGDIVDAIAAIKA